METNQQNKQMSKVVPDLEIKNTLTVTRGEEDSGGKKGKGQANHHK